MLEKLRKNNPHIHIYSVHDKEFEQYGKLLAVDAFELVEAADKLKLPETGSVYEASVPALERVEVRDVFEKEIYGEMPIQIGSCRGYSSFLNGLEWHKGSEINVGSTPFVLLLASLWDIKGGKVDSKDVKAFFVDKNEVIEVYSTTLHFCPCQVTKDGFNCVVILPLGTNVPLEENHADPYLFRKNKWLFAHVDNKALQERGVKPGIVGENIEIKGVEI